MRAVAAEQRRPGRSSLSPPASNSFGGARTFNHPEESRALQRTGSRPPFQVQHLRPSVERSRFHYPRAYLTTTARPPTALAALFLSHIIKTPYTRLRQSTRHAGCPAPSAPNPPEPLAAHLVCLCRVCRVAWRSTCPSISTEGCARRRWEIVA